MTTVQQNVPDYSLVIPVGDRVDDLDVLVTEYSDAMKSTGKSFEIVAVIDGNRNQWLQVLEALTGKIDNLRVIELARPFGESTALEAGFDAARADSILTLPAYYQIDPQQIPELMDSRADEDDMLIAVRPRTGASFDKIRRRTFHALFRMTSGMAFRDLGCGVRLLRRSVAEEIPLYGDQHRFFPALARRRGFRVREVELVQSGKDMFRGRYRLREYLHRFLDILTVFFLVRFTKKPLRFFGTIGFIAASLGALFTLVLVIQRLFFGVGLADRPALLLGSLLIVLGVQVFALGLIGELIIFTHGSRMKEYSVRRIVEGRAQTGQDSRVAAVQGE